MGEQWYNNKELFEMLGELKGDMQSLRGEIKATCDKLHEYNGLRDKFADVEKRLTTIEEQGAGRSQIGCAIREWGGWLFALITLGYLFYK